jgi:hypothetical protein
MASPSVTYPFINGQISAGPQVEQNFRDLVNGMTDGTSDLSINTLTLASGIVGNTAGTSVPTGRVGEILWANLSSNTNFASTTVFQEIISVPFTAGRWLAFGFAQFNANGSTSTRVQYCVTSSPGSGVTGLATGNNTTIHDADASAALADMTDVIPAVPIQISTLTTHYLKGAANFSAGTPRFRGTLMGIRFA